MALDGSPSAAYALDWALDNLVNLDKDELHLISVLVMHGREQVRCAMLDGRAKSTDVNLCAPANML